MQINSRILKATSAEVIYQNTGYLTGLFIAKALVGTLALIGFVDKSGTETDWVLPIGTVGPVVTGDSKIPFPSLSYVLSSASDAGVPLLTWQTIL